MSYKKPKIIAKNTPKGSYSSSCPPEVGNCIFTCETRQ